MQSMFEIQDRNPKFVKMVLKYNEELQPMGTCNWFDWRVLCKSDNKGFIWLDGFATKEAFKHYNDTFPVEAAVYGVGRSYKDYGFFYDEQVWKNTANSPEGRLRLWWIYNIAVAASKSEIDLDSYLA